MFISESSIILQGLKRFDSSKYTETKHNHMTVQVTSNGVQIPEEFHDAEKIVIRTPTQTIDMSSGFPTMVSDGVFPLITAESYEDIDDLDKSELENPSLAPNKISFKEYGHEAEEKNVEINI